MRVRGIAAGAAGLLILAGCSSDAKQATTTAKTTAPSTTAPAEKLRVLVTNDDGFAAPGIDTMVEALRADPDIEVTVVAPATNRSGTGSKTTPGVLVATEKTTASGYAAVAVEGFPADSVAYAFDKVLTDTPDLVVSGINAGQNIGPIAVPNSGTIGAATAAVGRGIPAIAVSAGDGDPIDFAAGAKYAMQWVKANTALLLAKKVPIQVVNLNTPTCTAGTIRGLRQEPVSTVAEKSLFEKVDCTQTTTAVTDDVSAFNAGFATVTNLDAAKQTVTATTSFPGG